MIDLPDWRSEPSIRPFNYGLLVLLGTMAVLWAMGRPLICHCGYINVWHGDVFSAQISQHLTDWYTLTHVLHGILIYAGLQWLTENRSPVELFVFAVAVECGWEIIENTDYVIEYYRQNTMAVAFYGDTVLNSGFDVLAMVVGYLTAKRCSGRVTLLIFISVELLLILVIRDSLTLNVFMLAYPIEAIKQWQMALM